MTTTVTTRNPVRSDVPAGTDEARTPRHGSRLWAVAGVGAAVLGGVTTVSSSMVDAVYNPDIVEHDTGIIADLKGDVVAMFVMHHALTFGAVLMLVFAAGLHRRLRQVAPDSLAPMIAFAGLAGTSVVSILGAGLDTEFMTPLATGDRPFSESSAAMFNHWTGTIPWLWTLAGLAGPAIWSVARRGGAPRWIGRVGLVLGGLTVLAGVSPAEYMAIVPGVLWLLATSLGFLLGDKQHRAA
ncbi:hypothetical protein [Nocardioides marmoribigeumensis]|jgi:hypothetical protein|uniref:DUF4386 family protein n=1 Tax=Nocardioides marmoribigeumensis TaxID=433649 RepID=A0ABU2BTP8_9ACTN|nr:hypothetical protein [Nocardioides marmoribigeumensis]MDR7361138.1 hypothetical protein [Nocardioides marmoribigeumensis]